MSQPTWQDECHRAAALFNTNDFAGASEIFQAICNRPDIDQASKSLIYLNVAHCQEKQSNHAQVMKAFDDARAVSLQHYFYVEQSRGVYLARVGAYQEALAIFEHLLKYPQLTGDYRKGCEENVAFIRSQSKAPSSGKTPAPVPAPTSTARFTEAPRATF